MPTFHVAALASGIEQEGGKRLELHGTERARTVKTPKWDIVWRNVVVFTVLHLISLYAVYLMTFKKKWYLFVYAYCYGLVVAQGITAGAHRLWAHRSYKAKLPLKLILLFLQTSAFQNSVFIWVRDHRAHHKFTDTDADPHNAKRGFFFSHMGWLLLRKKPDVAERGKSVDMSDIAADPYVMWQHRYYFPLMVISCFVLPTLFPWYFWGETYFDSFATSAAFRYIYSVHSTWLVNSAAHIYGMKPYDRNIKPSENTFVSFMACGEGFHNYHHVFPWDYKAAELGAYGLNWTLAVINAFARIGWAYDLKTVPEDVVRKRAARTGDGSWRSEAVWGWGDADMTEEDVNCALVLN